MEFQGFQNILPTLVVLILILALFLLSWFTYRKFESISTVGRWTLIALRSSSLILLLILLFNPYFYSSSTIEVQPKLAVFLDNSGSVDIEKGNYNGLESYNALLAELDLNERRSVQTEFYTFGEQVKPVEDPLPDATEIQSNLSDPIQSVLEMEDDVQAAIMITDGIISYGRNPSVNAFNSSIPIYTIALGDTSRVKDVSVSNVLTNTTGYTDTRHIVEAEITQSGFQDFSAQVSLLSGSEILAQKEIRFQVEDEVKTVQFELELEEAGLQQYEIRIDPLPEEWSLENNRSIFNIDVLDGKLRVLHVAFQIHPDVKAIRRVLQGDKSIELTTLTWLGGNRFVEEIPEEDDFNLIILHGLPKSNEDFDFLSNLNQKPSIYLNLDTESANSLSVGSVVELIQFSNTNLASVTLYSQFNGSEQAVLELPDIDISAFPPLRSPLRSTLKEPGAQALYELRFDGLETNSPAIASLERGNVRRTHILPWGWYRLLQSTNADQRSYTQQLISNIVSWTASDPENRLLRIQPAKRVFRSTEVPIINGSLQNERGEAESDGIIEFELSSEEGMVRTFNMENAGQGNYRLDLPRLSVGKYTYTATARKGNRNLETRNGEFLVANSSSELTNTMRNDPLLRSIATNSGASFFTYDQAGALWDSLSAKGLLQSQTEEVEQYLFPIRSVYWFLLVLLLLSTEWLLRKNYSLP